MKSEIVILVGSPGVGKTWVSNQLKHKFQVLEHDTFKDKESYVEALTHAQRSCDMPILGNSPFGISEIMEMLAKKHISTNPIFIIESGSTLEARYMKREGKQIPQGHLTRQKTYQNRAKDLGSFYGTSEEVLQYLRSL